MSFDVPMNLFMSTASVTSLSSRHVNLVATMGVVKNPEVFRVARRKISGLAGLFLHEF